MTNPYEILGVKHDVDGETLKTTYRRLARENHPDVAVDKQDATTKMARINQAWQLVGDPEKRAAFDARQKLDGKEPGERTSQSERSHQSERNPQNERNRQNQRAAREHFVQEAARLRRKSQSSGQKPASSAEQSRNKLPHDASDRRSASRRTPEVSKPNQSAGHAKKKRSGSRNGGNSAAMAPGGAGTHEITKIGLASRLFYREGRASEAADLCRAILVSNGRDVAARELLGDIFASQGRHSQAILVFDQAIQLSPTDRMLRYKREQIKQAQRAEKRAANDIKKAEKRARGSLWHRLYSRLKGKT